MTISKEQIKTRIEKDPALRALLEEAREQVSKGNMEDAAATVFVLAKRSRQWEEELYTIVAGRGKKLAALKAASMTHHERYPCPPKYKHLSLSAPIQGMKVQMRYRDVDYDGQVHELAFMSSTQSHTMVMGGSGVRNMGWSTTYGLNVATWRSYALCSLYDVGIYRPTEAEIEAQIAKEKARHPTASLCP